MTNARRREIEAERQALLDELAAGASPSDLSERIERVFVQDFDRTWGGRGVEARRQQTIALVLQSMLQASGVTDAEPPTISRDVAGGTEFLVQSRTRGTVSIGVLPHAVARTMLDQVPPLDRPAAAAAASSQLRDRTTARARRTAELLADGLTARQIGERIAAEEGHPRDLPGRTTVRDWIRAARKL